jgi:hypothetical protein
VQARVPVPGKFDVVPLAHEQALQQAGQPHVVLDQQERRPRLLSWQVACPWLCSHASIVARRL